MDAINRKYIPGGPDSMDRSPRFEQRFLVLRRLGQGTYGKVQLALNKETNEEVAVKTIKKAKIENEEDMLRIRREIYIMTSLRHPHIVHIHEVFETRQRIVIVMQYASGGELYDYLGCHQILPEDEARRIFRQIASAIYYCHKNQICHRDLKLENILLDEEGNAKIADFGLSNVFDDHHRMNTFCGSPLYASPEIVKGTPYKGPEVDCWSMGVLLYTLVYGTMPFDGRSFKELVTQISEGRYEEPVQKSNASSLIRWLLTPDISQRATIKDVCMDKWINKGYDTSLLEVAENTASVTRLNREQILPTKQSLETTIKNDTEKSIFQKAAEQIEEKAGKFTSLFTKNFDVNTKRNNAIPQTKKSSFYEQITNYDVQFVLNKLITTVEASIKAEKKLENLSTSESYTASTCNAFKKEEQTTEKIDSAYIIPIFEVTSTIPKDLNKSSCVIGKNTESFSNKFKISSRQEIMHEENTSTVVQLKEILDKNKRAQVSTECKKKSLNASNERSKNLLKTPNKMSSPPDQRSVSNQLNAKKADSQTGTQQYEQSFSHPSFRKSKRLNSAFSVSQKPPGSFLRTKNHVLSLARLLSLNYEKIMRNSFRMPSCKKKLPGKITIPPTFDPKNPPTKKNHMEEKILIFPTVSVSEKKDKIQKKIEKIKNAALNKNFIIRSSSNTRMRIENYIRSQVTKMHNLVLEEQRSLQASLENLDEQSLRDMSELYYRAFGSENTDSGIANTEDDDYFCFICSKPNSGKIMNGMVSSTLDNMKRGSLYTSNHLHVPKGKELNKWGCGSRFFNMELGSLSRCRSEINFPIEYLNYISTNKSDLSKNTYPQQQIQSNKIRNTKCFSAISSIKQQGNTNFRVLRSASDSVGLDFSKNTFDVVELNADSINFQDYKINPHFLKQITPNECKYYETTDYETQSFATDATFINRSQILENDDGIGDSNDSFQSYNGNLDSNTEHAITRSMSAHSCLNYSKTNSNDACLFTTISSDSHLKTKHESELDNFQRLKNTTGAANTLDSVSWLTTLENENDLFENKDKNKGLRRRNTMACLRRDSETEIVDPSSSEFESFLWNAYKEHLLENQTNADYSNSPNLNYYSLDRKNNFIKSERRNNLNGHSTYDYMSKLFPNSSTPEQITDEDNFPVLKNLLKQSSVSFSRSNGSRLNRTKSVCPELLSDSHRDDQICRLKEQRLWSEHTTIDQNESKNPSFRSNILNDVKKDREKKMHKYLNRKRYSSNSSSLGKSSEHKKSFLQLLALKRIQEAERELDKSNSSNSSTLEENPGSLLEALKTHGYKSVISQRCQDTDDEYMDSFYTRYLKSPRNLRAELARLNHMYYQSLPRYIYEENAFSFDDIDYTGSFLNELGTASYYESEAPTYCDMLPDFRHQSRQCVYDWLDSSQVDEYLSSLRPDSLNIPDETTSHTTSDTRKCCTQWGRENCRSRDDESTSDSQSTIEETPSNCKYSTCQKYKEQNISTETNFGNTERFQTSSLNMDDEKEESVQDRIWRKSFYSRFNNRSLFRKERSSLIESELPENRLGMLNNLYNSNLKSACEYTQGNGSFYSKRSKKHSQSLNKFDSRSSMKKLFAKPLKEHRIQLDKEESDNSTDLHNTNENEEPEH